MATKGHILYDKNGDIVSPVTSWKTVYNNDSTKSMETIDAENVKLTGSQTINGSKTFSSTIQGTARDANKVNKKATLQLNSVQLSSQFDGSAAVTWNIPLAGNGIAAGLVSNAAQDIYGAKSFNDNLTLGTDINNTITLISRFASDLLPSATGARSLGSNTNSWLNLYATGNISLGNIISSLLPDSTETRDLGSSSKKWNNLYVKTITGALSGNASSADKVNKKLTLQVDGQTTGQIEFDGSSDKTFNIPLAGSDAALGLISNTTQTIAGAKTLTGDLDSQSDSAFRKEIYFNSGIPAYQLGDVGPGGGYIFYDAGSNQNSIYLDSRGNEVPYTWRFLEVSPSNILAQTDSGDNINPPWGAKYDNGWIWGVVNGTSSRVGMGRYNTSLIVNTLGTNYVGNHYASSSLFPVMKPGAYAARVCQVYANNGLTDWWLPSIEELKFIYSNLHVSRLRPITNSWYWSSSQCDSYGAWNLAVSNQCLGYDNKCNSRYVRAVRGFSV